MSDLRLYSVNWQDGMLINKEHLADQEKYFEDMARWYAAGIGDGYGLIRKSSTGKPALSLNLSVSGSRLQVEVVRCQGITPDGSYIDIGGPYQEMVRGEVEIGQSAVPVYIGVDTEAKQRIGEPDPAEDVPRLPYLVNNYSVYLGEKPNISEGRCLQVAELVINGGEVAYAPDYFPPSLSVFADERLTEKAADYRNRLENLLALATRAFRATAVSASLAKESSDLQVAFRETINRFVYHLAATLDDFVIGPNAGHPILLVNHFKKLFRVFTTLVGLHPGLKDFLNEKFFTREMKSDIGRYLSSVENFIMTAYNHQDIGRHLQMIDESFEGLRGVMAFLAQTKRDDLQDDAMATETITYSGQTYRNVDYGTNRVDQVGELTYLVIETAEPCAMNDVVILISKSLFDDGQWRSMQVRLGLNEARGLGETDPVDVDTMAFANKVALHPRDMLQSSAVRQVTLIFRGAPDPSKFENLSRVDLIVYSV
ncbi:MAG: type VI secretion system baseplate subunit TssK [FCB group bacterium]|nr:type VI secretion system baseplate subunit TssK [FCB group bacterium]